jgi:hypothetical protein
LHAPPQLPWPTQQRTRPGAIHVAIGAGQVQLRGRHALQCCGQRCDVPLPEVRVDVRCPHHAALLARHDRHQAGCRVLAADQQLLLLLLLLLLLQRACVQCGLLACVRHAASDSRVKHVARQSRRRRSGTLPPTAHLASRRCMVRTMYWRPHLSAGTGMLRWSAASRRSDLPDQSGRPQALNCQSPACCWVVAAVRVASVTLLRSNWRSSRVCLQQARLASNATTDGVCHRSPLPPPTPAQATNGDAPRCSRRTTSNNERQAIHTAGRRAPRASWALLRRHNRVIPARF